MISELAPEPSGKALPAPACTLGEGPTYDRHTDTAWWFDITGRKLFEYQMESGKLAMHHLPVMASVLARIDGERQVLATEAGLMLRMSHNGALSMLMPIEYDDKLTRSNDGRVHACGAMWFGTMGKKAEHQAGSIYHVFKGKLTRLYGKISIPNAISFSPDGTIAYFTDTETLKLMRVPIDPKTALPLAEPKLFHHLTHGDGWPDGAVVDANGVLWNARWGAGAVDAYSPDGQRILSLDVPAKQSSCPAFVGRNAARLMVTSALEGLDAEARKADPEAGRTFLLDHAVQGRFEPDFILL